MSIINLWHSRGYLETTRAIRDLREQYRLTQTDFAKKIGVGLRTLARYENTIPPKSDAMIGLLRRLAADVGRKDLAEHFLGLLVSSGGVSYAVDLVETPWINGLQYLLENENDHTIRTVVDEVEGKILYALRQIKTSQIGTLRPARDGLRLDTAIDECEEALSRKTIGRKIQGIDYILFQQYGQDAIRPFQTLWTTAWVKVSKDHYGLFQAILDLSVEAIKGPGHGWDVERANELLLLISNVLGQFIEKPSEFQAMLKSIRDFFEKEATRKEEEQAENEE